MQQQHLEMELQLDLEIYVITIADVLDNRKPILILHFIMYAIQYKTIDRRIAFAQCVCTQHTFGRQTKVTHICFTRTPYPRLVLLSFFVQQKVSEVQSLKICQYNVGLM